MDKLLLLAQLKALAVEFRGRADAMEESANLLDVGYKSDVETISIKDARIAVLEKQLRDNQIEPSVATEIIEQ